MNSEDELRFVEENWDKAIVSNKVDEIAAYLSADWVIVGTDGITSREAFLESIRSGDLTHSRMDADETKITAYENSAVIISRGTSAGKYRGQDFELYEWSASTFIRKNEKWICVLTMVTPAHKS